jgi:EAL domain/PilZ domain
LVGALADSELAPERLELEMTEGVLLNGDPAIDKVLASIRKMGVRLVLDDFGTGYASLSYLKRVPFAKIKIDRSFVRGDADSLTRNQAIIRAMVGLADSLNMETVAEGAETLDEVELIRNLGCSQIQGYIFGFPMSPEQALKRALASPVPRSDTDAQTGEREPRSALLRVAELESIGHSSTVKIRNISARGALVEASGTIPLGLTATLTLSDGWTFTGEVRWRRGNRFGLMFDEQISLEDFTAGNPPPRNIIPAAAEGSTALSASPSAQAPSPLLEWLAQLQEDAAQDRRNADSAEEAEQPRRRSA